MAKYGNILTLIDPDNQTISKVKSSITSNNNLFENLDNVFFVETNSIKNTGHLIKKLNQHNINFLFFHCHHSDGSKIKSTGINPDSKNKITKILLK